MIYCEVLLSTSTRGRELKKDMETTRTHQCIVDLHERSWVEKLLHEREVTNWSSTSTRGRELKSDICTQSRLWISGRPPREVVSWKMYHWQMDVAGYGRPPREVVSWKIMISTKITLDIGRPPREVVSWKVTVLFACNNKSSRPPREVVSWKICIFAVLL